MDPKFVAQRFDQIAKDRKVSIRWLAEALGFNRYYINKLMRGDIRNGKDRVRLKALIEKLGYTEEQFFDGSDGARKTAGTVPLFGDIPAGNPSWFEGTPQPETWIEAPPFNGSRKLFALRVRGQSMEPRFLAGDILYLEPLGIRMGVKDDENPTPRLTFERLNNRVVAALVDGEATLKQLKIMPRGGKSKADDYELHLMPLNADYSPIVIGPHSTAAFQGVVVKLFRDEP
jgi:SOS-response transcriptional repressor LexA